MKGSIVMYFFVSKFPMPHRFQIDILKKICFEVGFVVRGIFSNNSKSQLRCLFPRSRTGLHCSTLDLWPSDLYLCIHILRLSWSNLEVEFEISCQLYWSKLEREWEITNKGFLDYGYLLPCQSCHASLQDIFITFFYTIFSERLLLKTLPKENMSTFIYCLGSLVILEF